MSLGPNRMSHTTINHTIIAPPFPTKRSWRTVGLDLPVQKTGEHTGRGYTTAEVSIQRLLCVC